MCFRFGSCFGVHVHDDCYAPPPPASKGVPVPPRHAACTKTPALRDWYYYYNNGHCAQQGIHRQPARAGNADRSNMPSAAVAATGGHGYAAGVEEKAHGYAGDASKRRPAAAWIDKVVAHGAGIGNGAQYYYYPTATATATSEHERY